MRKLMVVAGLAVASPSLASDPAAPAVTRPAGGVADAAAHKTPGAAAAAHKAPGGAAEKAMKIDGRSVKQGSSAVKADGALK